ncbi:PorT family protein [Flavobacterium buctense]|uniref:PorT family protein n=1 Tax=Flavobacterium buctense TaxID=1648146 RepID=A0ABU9DX72_9FLAO|nr:PorT family protein [Flavobacterium buctense]
MNKNLIILLLLATTIGSAQHGYRDSNMIGITLGLNQFNVNTSDFETKPGDGWNVGLSMRGNAFNDWDAIYGLQFSEYNFTVATLSQFLNERETNYKLSCANITFQLSYKFIENHLSVEFGPMVQVNGKLALDETDEDYIVKGNPGVLAKDLTDISNVTIYPVVGLTAGVRNVRLNVTYQYGINNMFGKIDGDFKGNASVVNGNIIFYF